MLLLGAVLASAGCFEDPETTRTRVFEAQRQDTYARCLAHGALENYYKQCALAGGRVLVVRHTHVCFDKDDNRNPSALGDGPYCVCHERDAEGRCTGEADCDGGVREKCDPLLTAELVPFYRPPVENAGPPQEPGVPAEAAQ